MSSIRVTITDKEALRALSWQAVETYLDATGGWNRVEDIPGTSVAYQHTDKDGRLREILVLLRDDLADYVSRKVVVFAQPGSLTALQTIHKWDFREGAAYGSWGD